MMGHIAAVAIAKPKEMRMKPASQLWVREEGREGGREGRVSLLEQMPSERTHRYAENTS